MNNVTVLLSTFNGQAYLDEQIKSILEQKLVEVHLIIRDDGSTDGTISILEQYRNLPNVDIVFGKNLGWKDSFMTLLRSATFDDNRFYAFSDQDDVWLPDKLIAAVRNINKKRPMLYHSNVTLMDDQGRQIGNRYATDFVPTTKMPNAFFDGFGIGATMVFNSELLKLLKTYIPIENVNHDAFVIAISNFFGETVYDSSSHLLYRRHSGATTGFGNTNHISHPTLIDRYRRYKKGPKNNFSVRARHLLVGYDNLLNPVDHRLLESVADYQNDIRKKLYLLFDPKMKATGIRRTLQVKYRVLMNTL